MLDTFVRALPHAFRDTVAPEGAVVRIEIPGEAGGCWFLHRNQEAWELFLEVDTTPAAEVVVPQDAAWRFFTKGLDRARARQLSTIRGDPILTSQVFATVAVIA